jgi:hypothetical protein
MVVVHAWYRWQSCEAPKKTITPNKEMHDHNAISPVLFIGSWSLSLLTSLVLDASTSMDGLQALTGPVAHRQHNPFR